MKLEELPAEILLKIFSYLNKKELGRISLVNSYFRDLAYVNSLWIKEAKGALVTNASDPSFRTKNFYFLSARERVRISRNWKNGLYGEQSLLVQNTRYMPRIQLSREALWISWGNRLWSHPRFTNGALSRQANRVLKGHTDDISRFVIKNGILVSGGLDRSIIGFDAQSGEFLFAKRYVHQSEISAVDIVPRKVIVTGSRDRSVKLWSMDADHLPTHRMTIDIGDRVWSLATDPFNEISVVVGSAGLGGVSALNILDLESGLLLNPDLGRGLRRGAGMLDIKWQTSATFLSCGHDSCARLWDVRTGRCENTWEEPYNEAVYCLATDNNTALLCGTARHGLVRLWDMRHRKPVQMFYVKHAHSGQSSPVYSIDFDQSHLYVAQDQCLNLLSFSGHTNKCNFSSFYSKRYSNF